MILSIVIPTYNRSSCIERLLSEVCRSRSDIEVVISDNNSPDDTERVCNLITKNDPRVKYHKNSYNKGFIRNVAQLPSLASGEYIWILADGCVIPSETVDSVCRILSKWKADKLIIVNGMGADGKPFKNVSGVIKITGAQGAMDLLGGHLQWLPSVIQKRDVCRHFIRKYERAGLDDPHFAAAINAVEQYGASFFGEVYVLTPGRDKDVDDIDSYGFVDKGQSERLKKTDWVDMFYLYHYKILKYLLVKEGIVINRNGRYGQYQDIQFVRTFAAERKCGGSSKGSEIGLAFKVINSKYYYCIYLIIRICPRSVLEKIWPFGVAFYRKTMMV